MVVGTSSSVGKSLLVAGLCRVLSRRGIRVAPFKAQNMSNNAAVCDDGGEIGRAQELQARAAGIRPTVAMNPVLLKPQADATSQVIVRGRPWTTLRARDFYRRKRELWSIVIESLESLQAAYDLILIEGAGSPVELNLKSSDIVNMAVAKHLGCSVLLVGDIDRGGIFAQLLGTLSLLEEDERRLVRGLIVNRFRGDPRLFDDGVQILRERGECPVVGVVPFVPDLRLPEEDAVAIEHRAPRGTATIRIVVIRLPRISNFDDFDSLERCDDVAVTYATRPEELRDADAVILPGTKSTADDLRWLRERELDLAILDHARRGGAVVGICGGYQMLGTAIHDPARVESSAKTIRGLGLLPVETTFRPEKATANVRAAVVGNQWPGWLAAGFEELDAYEIHAGETSSSQPWLRIDRGSERETILDGCVGPDGRVWGCYLHGLFQNAGFCEAWLRSLAPSWQGENLGATDAIDESLDRLADVLLATFDWELLDDLIKGSQRA
ncbi:cobyric acid synthase [Planctomycetes bacterium Pan216]